MRKQGFTCADCHARLTREWAEGNQRDSLSSAVSRGNQWTGPELELLLRDDLSNQELALMLGRTHYTISVMKSKVRNHPKYQAAAGVR